MTVSYSLILKLRNMFYISFLIHNLLESTITLGFLMIAVTGDGFYGFEKHKVAYIMVAFAIVYLAILFKLCLLARIFYKLT